MAAASPSALVALKTLFIVLACVMAAASAYLLVKDGDSSCFDLSALWTQVVITNVFAFVIPVVAWFFYKESSWIKRVVVMIVIYWFGSVVTCGYIAWLLFKLSHEESLKDPIYFVLARRRNGDVNMGRVTRSSHVTAKVIVTAIGCCLLGLIIYACLIDGFPFYAEVFTPCMMAASVDVCIHIVVFSVWIAYKESSWASAALWMLGLVCFSGFAICVYLVRELFYLSPPEQPVFLILFNKSNRDMESSDPLLVKHSNVNHLMASCSDSWYIVGVAGSYVLIWWVGRRFVRQRQKLIGRII